METEVEAREAEVRAAGDMVAAMEVVVKAAVRVAMAVVRAVAARAVVRAAAAREEASAATMVAAEEGTVAGSQRTLCPGGEYCHEALSSSPRSSRLGWRLSSRATPRCPRRR